MNKYQLAYKIILDFIAQNAAEEDEGILVKALEIIRDLVTEKSINEFHERIERFKNV